MKTLPGGMVTNLQNLFFSQINLQNLYFKMLFLFEPIWSTERIRNDRIRELDKDRIWYTCMIKSYSIICLLYTNNKLDNEMIEYKFYLNDKITLVIELHKITLHVYFLFFFIFNFLMNFFLLIKMNFIFLINIISF